MTDDVDRAREREQELRGDALRDQARRAGLDGKTAADSAEYCLAHGCEEPIPTARRIAYPGCRYCIDCQRRQEHQQQQSARRITNR